MQNFERRVFPANTTIFNEGDMAFSAYLLKTGRVEISTIKEGRSILLTTIFPNQLFGELALIDKSPRSATAVAVETSEVIIVKPEDFEKHLNGLDEFMRYWVTYLTDRVRDLTKRVKY